MSPLLNKPISTSLSPNVQKDDVLLALNLLFKPAVWKDGEEIFRLEEEFQKYLGVKSSFSFNSGRSAFLAILNSFEIKEGDEVLLQGFTCNSVVIPILKQGATPVFVDIDETLNINPADLEKKISKKTKAIVIQHTFGQPAKIEEILEICRKHNLLLIEDCAHSLGAEYKGKKAGTFGDAAFFSFGRDKIISSVFGGMAVTNDEKTGERLKEFRKKLEFPENFWILRQLLHPILTTELILPAYGLNEHLGRIIFVFLNKISILSKAVSITEKKGELPKIFPKKLPNALAILAFNQFKKLEIFNGHRRDAAKFCEQALKGAGFSLPAANLSDKSNPTFLRYPILVEGETDDILKRARKKKIYLDDGWRKTPVVPPDTDVAKMQYKPGSCPRAEKIAKRIVNLPTHINISRADEKKIIEFIKEMR